MITLLWVHDGAGLHRFGETLTLSAVLALLWSLVQNGMNLALDRSNALFNYLT